MSFYDGINELLRNNRFRLNYKDDLKLNLCFKALQIIFIYVIIIFTSYF